MNCLLCQNNLDLYLEGKLSERLQIQVKAHLESCPDCSRGYQLLILADQVIEAEKESNSNPFLVTRIMTGIEVMEGSVSAYRRIPVYKRVLRPILISASLAAAVFSGILLGNSYFLTEKVREVPVELSYMNDAALESVAIYSQL